MAFFGNTKINKSLSTTENSIMLEIMLVVYATKSNDQSTDM